MKIRIIGIDLAVTAAHKAIILDPAKGQFVGQPFKFRTKPQALDRLLQRARKGVAGQVQLVAVMEATAMAWYPVGVYLYDHGVHIYRVNGRQTRALRQVYWKYSSSDRIDCRVLAHLYQVAPDQLNRWWPPSGEQLALQRACREYVRWRLLDVAIQNRLKAYDKLAWNGLKHLVPATARPWMRQHWYNPWRVQEAGLATLSQAWQAASEASNPALDWIPRWLERARQMTTLYGSPQRVGYEHLQKNVRRNCRLRQQSLEERQALSRAQIQPLYRQLHPQRWLESIKGIGANSAAVYMAFIQDIHRFKSAAAFRKWSGMIPASRQSGEGQNKHMPLTQAGPNPVKATLYLNADVARQWDVQLAAVYYRQMVAYGKHHIQAVCACASHLASRIFVVLREQRPYELRDLQGHPITPEASRHLCRTRFRVPDEVRQRNNKRARRQRKEKRTEKRYRQRVLA